MTSTPKVEFQISLLKDAENYYRCANSIPHFGKDFTKCIKPEMLEKLKGKKWPEIMGEIIAILEKGYSKDLSGFKEKLEEIKNKWEKIGAEFFKRLEKITKHKIYNGIFTAYVTTIGRCPYDKDENWFMINIFWDLDNILTAICHELMHLQFHYYYEKQLREKISEKQFQDLKEALTVLLNLECSDILKGNDNGYPNHQELRKFIESEWRKSGDFDILIDRCVDYLKNKGELTK
jgi:hypothetical protein